MLNGLASGQVGLPTIAMDIGAAVADAQSWTREQALRVGWTLMDCAINATQWFEVVPDPNHVFKRGRPQSPKLVITPKEGRLEWLGKTLDAGKLPPRSEGHETYRQYMRECAARRQLPQEPSDELAEEMAQWRRKASSVYAFNGWLVGMALTAPYPRSLVLDRRSAALGSLGQPEEVR